MIAFKSEIGVLNKGFWQYMKEHSFMKPAFVLYPVDTDITRIKNEAVREKSRRHILENLEIASSCEEIRIYNPSKNVSSNTIVFLKTLLDYYEVPVLFKEPIDFEKLKNIHQIDLI